PNVSSEIKASVLESLGLSLANSHDRYLGLPTLVGRDKKQTFRIIKERVSRKLQLWKSRLFSQGGKEILIKAVAQAIPSYSMSVFRLPRA
ncbi:hypothetical protein, partial [Salmonella sp. SAL4439]|uniref:hypothetical protein n=1 Tax=Salmonella sp. SAL4439 TaxID=3159894 RepID=UPI00397C0A93